MVLTPLCIGPVGNSDASMLCLSLTIPAGCTIARAVLQPYSTLICTIKRPSHGALRHNRRLSDGVGMTGSVTVTNHDWWLVG